MLSFWGAVTGVMFCTAVFDMFMATIPGWIGRIGKTVERTCLRPFNV